MIRSKDIFMQLKEEEAYVTGVMRMVDYESFPQPVKDKIGVSVIQKKEPEDMKNNVVYRQLMSNLRNAKNELEKFKFERLK